MKVLFVVTAFLAAALAEEMMLAESYPVGSYSVGPAVSSSSAGNAYGAYGGRSAGYGAYGRSKYGDQGLYSDKANAAKGYHNVGAARSLDAYGAQASNYGKYKNVGAYAQDKGDGYEKAYAYDKKAGHHAILSDYGARSGQYGVQDKKTYSNVGDYARSGHDRYGAQNKYGANAYGVQAHDNSNYGKYGKSEAQSYKLAPAVFSYSAPAPVSYNAQSYKAAPIVSSYSAPSPVSYGAQSYKVAPAVSYSAPAGGSYGAPSRY